MENDISFEYSAENIEYSRNLSYLLNFWYTTKLNKENEFIKRNGIHPSIVPIKRKNHIDIEVAEGNSIQTNFYTVFRIFIENLFDKQVKTIKERNQEEWIVSFKNDIQGLDSKAYLLFYYARTQNLNSELIEYINNRRGHGYRYTSNPNIFSIKLRNKDQLHSKKLVESLDFYETNAQRSVDQAIGSRSNELVKKIKLQLNATTKETVITNIHSQVINSVTRAVVIENAAAPELRELMPYYQQLNPSINGMDARARFSFILSYAQQSGNAVVNRIQNNETNFTEFLRLTNNMTL